MSKDELLKLLENNELEALFASLEEEFNKPYKEELFNRLVVLKRRLNAYKDDYASGTISGREEYNRISRGVQDLINDHFAPKGANFFSVKSLLLVFFSLLLMLFIIRGFSTAENVEVHLTADVDFLSSRVVDDWIFDEDITLSSFSTDQAIYLRKGANSIRREIFEPFSVQVAEGSISLDKSLGFKAQSIFSMDLDGNLLAISPNNDSIRGTLVTENTTVDLLDQGITLKASPLEIVDFTIPAGSTFWLEPKGSFQVKFRPLYIDSLLLIRRLPIEGFTGESSIIAGELKLTGVSDTIELRSDIFTSFVFSKRSNLAIRINGEVIQIRLSGNVNELRLGQEGNVLSIMPNWYSYYWDKWRSQIVAILSLFTVSLGVSYKMGWITLKAST